MASPAYLLGAVGASAVGVELLLAQAVSQAQVLPDTFDRVAQIGGTSALIIGMGLALRYMRSREERATELLKEAHAREVKAITDERDYHRARAERFESTLLQK